jgi:hypothetical protein
VVHQPLHKKAVLEMVAHPVVQALQIPAVEVVAVLVNFHLVLVPAAQAALALSSYATQHLISLSLCSTLLPSGLLLSA